jgi:hypothetical protein
MVKCQLRQQSASTHFDGAMQYQTKVETYFCLGRVKNPWRSQMIFKGKSDEK